MTMQKIEGDIEPNDNNQSVIGKRGFTQRGFDFLLQKICDYETRQEQMKSDNSYGFIRKPEPLIKVMNDRDQSRYLFRVT